MRGTLLSNKPVWWMKHGKHTSSRQNPIHLSSCYCRSLRILGGLSSILCHYRISGGTYRFTVFRAHPSQKCFRNTTVVFNHFDCKKYRNKHKHIRCQQTAAVHQPNVWDLRVSHATIYVCKEVKTGHFQRMNGDEFDP